MSPSSFKKAYGETQSANMEVSGTMVKSLHVLPSPLDEKFPQLPDSSHVFSSDSGCPTRVHYSPISPNTSGSISSTVYSLSPKDGACFLVNQHPYSVMQSTQLDGYAMENNDVSWNEIENFLDTPLKIADQDDQIETSTEDHAKKSNWQDWAEQFISVNDETLNSNWSDLLVDNNLPDSEPKVCFSIPMHGIVKCCLMLSDVNLKIVSFFLYLCCFVYLFKSIFTIYPFFC